MTGATGRFTRADRLRRSREFQYVTRQGHRAASSAYVVLAVCGDSKAPPRLGLTVSRKVGKAVVRNRVKRRIREWFRQERGRLAGGTEIVVIARREAAGLGFADVASRLSALATRAARP